MNSEDQMLGGRYSIVSDYVDGFIHRKVATDNQRNNRYVSIMSLTKQGLDNPNVLAWFRRHSNTIATISHPSVVDFYDSESSNSLFESPAIVTEYLDKSLHEVIEEDNLTEKNIKEISISLLSALTQIHDKGLLHLDLNPKTITVSKDLSAVKLLDLGNCSPIDDGSMSLEIKAKYTAPETYQSDAKLDRRTDLYSLGMILYEASVGRTAFNNEFSEIIENQDLGSKDQSSKWTNWHLSPARVAPPHELRPNLDKDMSISIHAMIDKNIENRNEPASAELEQGIDTTGFTGSFHEQKKQGFMEKHKNLLVYCLLGLLFLGVVAGGLFVKSSNEKKKLLAAEQARLNTELNELVAKYNSQVEISTSMEFEKDELTEEATVNYKSAYDAQQSGDLNGAVSFFRKVVDGYDSHIDNNAEAKLGGQAAIISSLMEYGVETNSVMDIDVDENLLTTAFTSYEELSSKNTKQLELISSYSTDVQSSPREIELGSTDEEIDEALKTCRENSVDDCDRAWYQTEEFRTVTLLPFMLEAKEVSLEEFDKYVVSEREVTEAEERNFSGQVVLEEEFMISIKEGLSWRSMLLENASVSDKVGLAHVTFNDAVAYCDSVGMRLPTENEWEYSARGNQRLIYPWGNEWQSESVSWREDNKPGSNEIGKFPPSNLEHYDLLGSVSEWTLSEMEEEYSIPNTDETSILEGKSENLNYAVIKGSSRFDGNQANIRSAIRRIEFKDYSGEDVGFRCAKSVDLWPGAENAVNLIIDNKELEGSAGETD